jgi:protein required for attachment to host cells
MKIVRTWYVIADGGRARFVERREPEGAYDTLRELVSADLRHQSSDLGSDRPGRTRDSATATSHAVQPRQDPHQAEKRKFVHEVADLVNEESAAGAFDRLILVAPARPLAELRDALDAPTLKKVAAELQKDLTKIPNAGLAAHLDDLGHG